MAFNYKDDGHSAGFLQRWCDDHKVSYPSSANRDQMVEVIDKFFHPEQYQAKATKNKAATTETHK